MSHYNPVELEINLIVALNALAKISQGSNPLHNAAAAMQVCD